jgi:hypothetical protein
MQISNKAISKSSPEFLQDETSLPGKTLWFWAVGKKHCGFGWLGKNICVRSQRGGLKGVYYHITIIMI